MLLLMLRMLLDVLHAIRSVPRPQVRRVQGRAIFRQGQSTTRPWHKAIKMLMAGTLDLRGTLVLQQGLLDITVEARGKYNGDLDDLC
jgi:hypothetical protein